MITKKYSITFMVLGVTLIAAGLLVFSPQTALSPGCLPTL